MKKTVVVVAVFAASVVLHVLFGYPGVSGALMAWGLSFPIAELVADGKPSWQRLITRSFVLAACAAAVVVFAYHGTRGFGAGKSAWSAAVFIFITTYLVARILSGRRLIEFHVWQTPGHVVGFCNTLAPFKSVVYDQARLLRFRDNLASMLAAKYGLDVSTEERRSIGGPFRNGPTMSRLYLHASSRDRDPVSEDNGRRAVKDVNKLSADSQGGVFSTAVDGRNAPLVVIGTDYAQKGVVVVSSKVSGVQGLRAELREAADMSGLVVGTGQPGVDESQRVWAEQALALPRATSLYSSSVPSGLTSDKESVNRGQ